MADALIMNSEAALPDAKEDLVGVKEKLEQEKMNIPLTADNLEKLESEAKCINGANAETEAVISKLRDSEKETVCVYIFSISLSYLSRIINA